MYISDFIFHGILRIHMKPENYMKREIWNMEVIPDNTLLLGLFPLIYTFLLLIFLEILYS